MDCTDIVIGMARGDQFRVFDYFTRDRGQPYRDDFYNGVDSLTAAVGREEDGYTYIKWRRPLITGSYRQCIKKPQSNELNAFTSVVYICMNGQSEEGLSSCRPEATVLSIKNCL